MGSGFSVYQKNLSFLAEDDIDEIENTENPSTQEISLDYSLDVNDQNNLDPRSPTTAVSRTPIKGFSVASNGKSKFENSPNTVSALQYCENPKKLLKNKITKEIDSKLTDPRSPNQFINRTPIVFGENDDSSTDTISSDYKSFDLNDTFSDLFVMKNDEGTTFSSSPMVDGQNKNVPMSFTSDEKDKKFERDPRSALFNVDVTPIDDDGGNVSSENVSEVDNAYENEEKIVYEDDNDANDKQKESTKVFKEAISTGATTEQTEKFKRTPFSCMRNISHLKNKKIDISDGKMLNENFNNLKILKYCTIKENGEEENRI